jgi:hypothetical protein
VNVNPEQQSEKWKRRGRRSKSGVIMVMVVFLGQRATAMFWARRYNTKMVRAFRLKGSRGYEDSAGGVQRGAAQSCSSAGTFGLLFVNNSEALLVFSSAFQVIHRHSKCIQDHQSGVAANRGFILRCSVRLCCTQLHSTASIIPSDSYSSSSSFLLLFLCLFRRWSQESVLTHSLLHTAQSKQLSCHWPCL